MHCTRTMVVGRTSLRTIDAASICICRFTTSKEYLGERVGIGNLQEHRSVHVSITSRHILTT